MVAGDADQPRSTRTAWPRSTRCWTSCPAGAWSTRSRSAPGMEYWANEGTVNPVTARARFRESLDMIIKGWTQDGPFRYDGEFYTYRYLNPGPSPTRSRTRSATSSARGARRRSRLAVDFDLGYSIVFVPIAESAARVRAHARAGRREGPTVDPDDLIIVVMAYVADTDEEAMREARPHIESFFSWFHRVTPRFLLPPGYVSTKEFLRRVSDAAMAEGTKATLGRHGVDRPHRLRLPRNGRGHDRRLVPGSGGRPA